MKTILFVESSSSINISFYEWVTQNNSDNLHWPFNASKYTQTIMQFNLDITTEYNTPPNGIDDRFSTDQITIYS